MDETRILTVDDHRLFREVCAGFSRLLPAFASSVNVRPPRKPLSRFARRQQMSSYSTPISTKSEVPACSPSSRSAGMRLKFSW